MTTKTKKQTKPSTKTLKNKIKKLEDTIQKISQELYEKNDKLLRCIANQQNQQKRFEKELKIHENQTKKKYLLELLDLYDLLKKAQNDNNPQEGIKLLLQNLNSFLENENITYIKCKGQPFDHQRHHAITCIEHPDSEDNIIIDEIKKGYLLGDLLLRPSHVIVAKKKEVPKNNEKKYD